MKGMGQWGDLIAQAAQRYDVDPRLIASVVQVESGGNPSAVSEVGAEGLGQQMPATAKALGVDPTNPASSIEGVAKLLDENLRRYGNPQDAILAYHGGTDQANWGPKTRNYLAKVSATYGAAPAMPTDFSGLKKPDAAVPDFFSQQFGTEQTASAPSQNFSGLKPPTAEVPDFFSQQFGTAETPVPTAPASSVSPLQVAAPSDTNSIPGMAWQGLQMLGEQGLKNANAIGQGISESLDAPSEWLASGAEASGLTGLLNRTGAKMPTYAEQVALNAQSRQNYETANLDAGLSGALSKAGGNVLGVMLPIGGAEAGLAKGAGALSDALNMAPATAAKIGTFLKGEGGLASRVGYNAGQGAAAGALLSGGQPDGSTADAAAMGALLGGALPIASGSLGYGKNLAKSAVAPFTASGREGIAQKAIQEQAAKYTPALAADDALAQGTPALPGATTFTPGTSTLPAPGAPALPGGAAYNPLAPTLGGTSETAMNRAAAGGRTAADFAEYVPGSQPTLAQATGNGGIAALERAAKGRAPNEFTERELQNYAARNQYFDAARGTPETLQAAAAAREEVALPLLGKALEGASKADTSPVLDTIKGILTSEAGQRDAVKNALQPVIKKLQIGQKFESNPLIPGSKVPQGVNGNGLQYDVNQLYGIRKSINDQLENVTGRDNSAAQQASRELIQVRDSLDKSIELAAPGFKNYLATYSEMSKPIASQNYLQNLNLTDATSNRITLPKVKAALDRIEKLRKAPGANDAKTISDDQMQVLNNLHKDLQREANSARGMSIGSNTFQNLATNQLIDSIAPGKLGATIGAVSPATAGGALGWALGGPMGAGIGTMAGQQLGGVASRAAQAQGPEIEAKLIDYLLNPRGASVLTPQAARRSPEAAKTLSRALGAESATTNSK